MNDFPGLREGKRVQRRVYARWTVDHVLALMIASYQIVT